jgi:hypothetical protein
METELTRFCLMSFAVPTVTQPPRGLGSVSTRARTTEVRNPWGSARRNLCGRVCKSSRRLRGSGRSANRTLRETLPRRLQGRARSLAKKYYKELILLFVDGAGNHCSDELEIPANIILHLLPPY